MEAAKDLFSKFGGHRAAGGFSFPLEREAEIRERLLSYAQQLKTLQPQLWQSSTCYDTELDTTLLDLRIAEALADLKPSWPCL